MAYTTLKDVEAIVDWSKLINDSSRSLGVRFEPAVNYTFGFAMPRIYEYDDDDDNVDLNDNTYMVVHEFQESTKWKMDFDNSTAQVKFTTNNSIIFKVRSVVTPTQFVLTQNMQIPCHRLNSFGTISSIYILGNKHSQFSCK